jgi:hypothetical protein
LNGNLHISHITSPKLEVHIFCLFAVTVQELNNIE